VPEECNQPLSVRETRNYCFWGTPLSALAACSAVLLWEFSSTLRDFTPTHFSKLLLRMCKVPVLILDPEINCTYSHFMCVPSTLHFKCRNRKAAAANYTVDNLGCLHGHSSRPVRHSAPTTGKNIQHRRTKQGPRPSAPHWHEPTQHVHYIVIDQQEKNVLYNDSLPSAQRPTNFV
jgi:hypothetical protein